MPKTFEGQLTGEGRRIGIVVSRFNHFITERLLEGAVDAFVRHGVRAEDVNVYRVPGSFEIPLVAKKVAEAHKVDGVLAIGALIRGSTPHFDFIAAEVTKGVSAIALELGLPMTFGVLTTDTIEQAIERAGTKAGNKGWESALALIEIINLYETID